MFQDPNQPILNQPFLYINGMTVSNDGVTPNTKLNVSSGVCRTQDNVNDLNLGNFLGQNPDAVADVTTTIDATFNGVNGLDTGSLGASKVYYVYAIGNPINPSVDTIISLAAPDVGPQMPTNYATYRHIGYAITDASSHFLKMQVAGNNNVRKLFFNDIQATAVTAGASTSYAAVALTNFVPKVDNLPVYLTTAFTPAAASDTLTLKQGITTAGDQAIVTGQVAAVIVTSNLTILSNVIATVPTVFYKVSAGAVAVNVAGFEFYI